MKVIRTKTRIGKDRILRITLPDDAPTGEVNVTVTLEPTRREMTPEERRAAADAGAGALRGVGGAVEEFLAERREDDQRRDKALGL